MQPAAEVDFVVVGAGSAGSVLAARLSENGRHTVALLEAGPSDRNFWIHLPIGYGKTMWDPRVNWRFYTEPDAHMDNRRLYWPRGRVLGGSSSINGLIAIRGQAEDYDGWRALGNPGWGFGDVLPYFIKLENNHGLEGDRQLHGMSGPLHVTSITGKHELIEAVIGAAGTFGVPYTDDFNGRQQEGVGYYQLTTHRGWRVSAAKAYLKPAKRRTNLTILTEAQATRLLFTGRRASGIEYRQDGAVKTIQARHGVILAAGAVQSPQLLMLSGIGPAEHLRDHGIAILTDSPGVGLNLQDHLQLRLIYRVNQPITTNDAMRTLSGRVRMALEWLFFAQGPLAIGINQGGLFTKVLPQSRTPDIQFHIATLSADMAGGMVHDFPGFTLSVCQLRPESRGTIRLASGDPLAAPLIHSNYLSSETDRRCAVASLVFARRLAATKPLADYVVREELPGPSARSDADLLSFARSHGATIFHPVGTCKMGPPGDSAAVVDPRLRVRGVERLWVADCSVMPKLVSGNTNLPAIMIGEKASDMIREDTR